MSTEDPKEKLLRYFAKRVTTQARIVLDSSQKLDTYGWQDEGWFNDLKKSVAKLKKQAQRFDLQSYVDAADKLNDHLAQADFASGHINPDQKALIDEELDNLRKIVRRKSDTEDQTQQRVFVRTPIYVALNDEDSAAKAVAQLDFYGFRAEAFNTANALQEGTRHNKPETIIIDVNFGGPEEGIRLIERIQASHDTPIPVIFNSQENLIQLRLAAVRCGGEEFINMAGDPGVLIERVEKYTSANPMDPYRVLICDDSRAQSRMIDNVLQKGGMITHVINDPMEILIALDEFLPEIILLDMYMPGCTGMELAKLIRQQNRLHSVPIIYLSAEDDVNKQLHAMSLGGDDFLTKPIDPRHLVATIHNRGRRARSLMALMIRDSLTGLYNHTHTLYLLGTEISKSRHKHTPLCFAMLDIDYFKKVNDTYGHPIGDRVLKSLAMFLKQRMRKTDHIGRYGGEEFALILPNTSADDALKLLDEIREQFSQLKQPTGETEFQVTFSCGVAQSSGETPQELNEKADKALYEAKHKGRNNVTLAPN